MSASSILTPIRRAAPSSRTAVSEIAARPVMPRMSVVSVIHIDSVKPNE